VGSSPLWPMPNLISFSIQIAVHVFLKTSSQRFVPDSLKLRSATFEHAHRRFAELSHIDHGIKLCPLFADLGDRARSGVQKSSNSVCTDIQWESSSHQHLQIRQLSDEVSVKCRGRIIPIRWFLSFCVSC